MSLNALAKLRDKLKSAQHATRRAREKAGEVVMEAVHTGEGMAIGFGAGVLYGRYPEAKLELAGVPMDLGVGVGLKALALLGVSHGAGPHMNALGTGALTSFSLRKGLEVGADMAKKANAAPGYSKTASVSGDADDAVRALLKASGARVAGTGYNIAGNDELSGEDITSLRASY